MLNFTCMIESLNMKIILSKSKPANPVAKDLRSPKYRMRVVNSKKRYDRNQEKRIVHENQFC